MGRVVAQNGMSHSLTSPQLSNQVSPQLTVAGHIPAGELHINVMQKPGKPPLLLILTKASGQSPHNSLGSQHVLYQVFVFNIGLNRIKCLFSGHFHLLMPPTGLNSEVNIVPTTQSITQIKKAS